MVIKAGMLNLSKIFKVSLIFSVLLYMGYNIFYGNRGVIALIQYDNKYTKVLEELEEAKSERLLLEHKVKLLKSSSLDLDMLEETAKKKLSLIKKDEIMVYTPN